MEHVSLGWKALPEIIEQTLLATVPVYDVAGDEKTAPQRRSLSNHPNAVRHPAFPKDKGQSTCSSSAILSGSAGASSSRASAEDASGATPTSCRRKTGPTRVAVCPLLSKVVYSSRNKFGVNRIPHGLHGFCRPSHDMTLDEAREGAHHAGDYHCCPCV